MANSKDHHLKLLEKHLSIAAPYMSNTIDRCRNMFGKEWSEDFEHTLEKQFNGDLLKIQRAVKGYINFSLEAVLLQKRFSAEKQYSAESLEKTVQEVYDNREYMFDYYLPANLLIHFLWPHHCCQLQFVKKHFVKYVLDTDRECSLCDVGVGSGFYSRFILEACPNLIIQGYDISDNSLEYAKQQIDNFGLSSRWKADKCDIAESSKKELFDFAMSVEILEHLVDPVKFLKAIKDRLKDQGKAFISVAIAAAQRDHIYLYNDSDEVVEHLSQAGFKVLRQEMYEAHEPKDSDIVPKLGVYILEKL